MILKVNDTSDFNLSLRLNINYDLEYIELTVCFHNKKKQTMETKCFPASKFSQALSCYKQYEAMFL